jgi:hypothetical protein
MSCKSYQAFKWSIDKIAALAKAEGKQVYLWTFTFSEALDVKEARKLWTLFAREMVVNLNFRAVRVFELHPGGHGLHIHAVACGRVPVRLVRQLSRKHKFGRIHVGLVRENAYYIGKYLSKSNRAPCLRGARLWQTVGLDKRETCRVRDVSIDSLASRSVRVARALYPAMRGARLFRQADRILSLALRVGSELRDASFFSQVEVPGWMIEGRFVGLYQPALMDRPVVFSGSVSARRPLRGGLCRPVVSLAVNEASSRLCREARAAQTAGALTLSQREQ